jgi:quinol monooxygenase YgiN
MSVSFLAAAAAALVAAVITGVLVRRLARLPRLHMTAWMLAAAGTTIALAALALGFHHGFNASAFRAVQIGARLIAPIALAWGLIELVGKSFAARFAGRLALGALTVIAGVILAADPLSGGTFTTAWPAAADHYQLIPTKVLLGLAVVTALWALAALAVAAVRAQRQPVWRDALPPVAAAAVAVLLTEGLAVRLPVKSGYAALCLAVAALTWFAGQRASRLRLGALHDVPDMGDTGWRDRYTDDSGFGYQSGGAPGPVSGDTDFGGFYRPGSGRVGGADFDGLYRPDDGGYRGTGHGEYGFPDTGDIGSDPGYGFYRTDTDLKPIVNGEVGRPGEPVPGIVETGDILPVAFDVFAPTARPQRDDPTDRLFGQIAIYTLLDGHAEEFDRLAQQVVEQVKALEPGTLAYIVHGVPSAPMQRILYEVYRDGEAYQEHCGQPYIQEFDDQRAPLVLATNVIELGVRQAKLSPLSSQDVPPSQPGMAGQAGRGNGGGPAAARPRSGVRQSSEVPQHSDAHSRADARPRGDDAELPGEDARHRAGSRPPRDAGGERGQARDPARPGDPGQYHPPGWHGDPARPTGAGWQDDAGYPAGAGLRGDAGYPGNTRRPGDAGYPADAGRHSGPGYPADARRSGDAGFPADAGHHGGPGHPAETGSHSDPGYPAGAGRRGDPGYPADVPPLPDDLAAHPRLAGRSGVYGRPRPDPPPDPAGRPPDNGSR